MAGRETRRKPELPLTEDERLRLGEAREVVRELAEREPPPEELSELGYEQRMARGRALELAVTAAASGNVQLGSVVDTADLFYRFIWKGETNA